MGLFDSIGQFLGITSSYKAKAPEFINQQYLSGLENTARAIESRPDTTSFADALLQQAQMQQMQQANALAGSARGNVNPALLQRNVMRQQSEAAQGAANQASVVRAQEALQNRSLNDQLALQYRQLGLGAAGQQANLGLQAQGINAGIDQSNTRNTAGLFGGLINAAGGILSRPSSTQSKPVYAEGGFVDGVPNVPGDSELNDTVDIKASPGEIIVPRSYAQNADMAKEFIDHIMASKQKAPVSYADILKAKKKVDSYAQGGEVMSDAEVEAEMRQKALEKNYGLDPVAAFKARFEPPQLYKKPESISDEQLADLRQAGQSELVSGAMGGTNLPMPMAIGAIRKTPTGKLLGTVGQEVMEAGESAVKKDLASQALEEGLVENVSEAKAGLRGPKTAAPRVGEGFIKEQEMRTAAAKADPTGYGIPLKEVPKTFEQEMIFRLKNRFGDHLPEKSFKVAEATAKSKNTPYAAIKDAARAKPGEGNLGFFPNYEATPTGKIGDLKDFKTADPYKIWESAEQLNWHDMTYASTKKLIEKHLESNIPVEITTASDLIAHDDYSKILPQGSRVNIVLANNIKKDGSFYGPLPSERRMLLAYDKLKQEGIEVNLYKKDGKELRKMKPFEIKQLQKQKNAYYTPSEEGAK